jgi:hypothetical protein
MPARGNEGRGPGQGRGALVGPALGEVAVIEVGRIGRRNRLLGGGGGGEPVCPAVAPGAGAAEGSRPHSERIVKIRDLTPGPPTQLLRGSPQQNLHILEQARFVDELKSQHGMSLAEIARQLSRSKAWVSLRLGLIAPLSPVAREALFSGAFPVYSYLYSLRRFRRVNSQAEVDQFIGALRGQKLSVREIEGLAHGFFRGPEFFRKEILRGNFGLALEQMQQAPADPDSCSELERVFLHDLELTQKTMTRVITKSADPRLQSPAFLAQCNLLTAILLSQNQAFVKTLRHLHDHTAKT